MNNAKSGLRARSNQTARKQAHSESLPTNKQTAVWQLGSGVLLFVLLLLLFSDVFGASPLFVGGLAVPTIGLAFYALRRRLRFVQMPSRTQLGQKISRHKYLLLVNLVFAALCLPLAKTIPYIPGTVGAPDEHQHYGKNVEFILKHERLPVAGKDDTDSLRNCRDNPYGKVTCRYSYQFTPAFNYIISAMAAAAGGYIGLSELMGARLASIFWGIVFLNSLYLLCRLFLDKRQALYLAMAVGFIPQIVFISSYVNQDIHSLAIATLLLYGTLGYVVFGRQRLRWLMYITFGLLFTAKYNYFLAAIVPFVFLGRSIWPQRDWRRFLRESIWLAGGAAALAGFWFVRNYALYGDFLGQGYILQEMLKYHAPGTAWSLLNPQSYLLLFEFDVFHALLRSFFAQFGYLYVSLNESFYMLIQLALVAGAVVLAYFSSRKSKLVLLAATAFLGLAFAQIVYNAFTYDFQFQGRYLYVALPSMVAAIAYTLADINRRIPQVSTGFLLGMVSITGLLVVESILVLATVLATYKG